MREIPDFPVPTVESHSGRLLLGHLSGQPVVAMQGRFHRYEGYSFQQVTFPVRVMRDLGAESLIVSNACGGMNPMWDLGDLMLIADHINLLGDNPLIGPNLDELGPRFPDMSEPYDLGLQRLALDVAREEKITLRRGVYVAVPGPNLGDARRVPFPAPDRRGRGGHVHGSGSDRSGARRNESAGYLDRNRYLPTGCIETRERRRDHPRGG